MLVALAGWGRTGKDEFYKAVKSKYPKAARVAFADEVKRDCQDFLDSKFPGQFDLTKEADKLRWVSLLISWGDTCRAQDPENAYWIKRLLAAKRNILENPRNLVILTDCRYLNECEWAIARGGVLVRLHRKGAKPRSEVEERTLRIIDEANLDCVALHNDDDLQNYHRQCIEVFENALIEKGIVA